MMRLDIMPACQTNGLAFQLIKMLVNIGGIVIALKAHLLERVLARSLQLCQLFAANALQLVQFLRGLLVLILRLMLFCHIFPIFHIDLHLTSVRTNRITSRS